MAVKPGKQMIIRTITVMVIVIAFFFSVTLYQFVNIMIINGEKLQSMASEQQLYDSLVTAPRGDIYDANMQVLATSTTAWTVYITPNSIKAIEDEEKRENVKTVLAEKLSEILEVDRDTVYENTSAKSYYVIVKKKIEKEDTDKVRSFLASDEYKDLGLASHVGLEETTKRYYPSDSLASEVLGFVGSDDQGLAGIESYYDTILTGIAGRVIAAKNAVGTDLPLTYEKVEDAQKGNSLVLTVDNYVQYTAEKYLEAAIEENAVANRGVAIVMNVNTGAILAMAVKGDFNPNEPFKLSESDQALVDAVTNEEEKSKLRTELLNKQWRNKAVSDSYEPGSVFKVFTASMAIEEDLVGSSMTFYCSGHTTVASQGYDCHKLHGHGSQTIMQALSNSCNPAFITIGQLVGVNLFSKYFKAFGFTQKTGIDLPGEGSSTYHAEENMTLINLASESFGQTFNVTPIQMITGVAAVVNGGYLVQPHLVSKIVDENGSIVKVTNTDYKRQVISEETSATMRELMEFVSENGAKNALVAGYDIGAKTGTSQKVSQILSSGNDYLYISSCVTVAPIDDPEIAVLVLLDEPTGNQYYGGIIAAPVNSRIMADVLPYLGYVASYSEDELDNVTVTVPETVGLTLSEAKNKINNSKLEYRVVGKGENVLRQLPESGNQVLSGGIVILYTEESGDEEVKVPQFVGLTAAEVNKLAATSGINIEFSGNISSAGLKAYMQSVNAGETVDAGSIVTVYFRDETSVDG